VKVEDAEELRDVELAMLTNVGNTIGVVAQHGIIPTELDVLDGLQPSREIEDALKGISEEKDSISISSLVIAKIDHEIYEWDVIVFYLHVQNNAGYG
jgi:hypothetical protein